MSKAILIVGDYPIDCNQCPAMHHINQEFICIYADWKHNHPYVDIDMDKCPLVPMPERNYGIASWVIGQAQKTDEDVDYWRGYVKGWNSCLDEIEGGES